TIASDVAVLRPASAAAALIDPIAGQHAAGGNGILARELRVVRREVRTGRIHQLLVAVDHEIGLLVGIDAVARAHDALEIEADAVWRGRFQAMNRFAFRRHDARTINAQRAVLADQAEFD